MAEHLFQGGWKTTSIQKLTTITGTVLAEPRVFKINCVELADTDAVKFNFLVDGERIEALFFEGSYVFIEGKSVLIEQLNNGVNFSATWEVVQRQQEEFERTNWFAYPSLDEDVLIASFVKPQEFVLSFNAKSDGCSNGSLIVKIDGVPVKDYAGNNLSFVEGASIIGFGKKVTVQIQGNCTQRKGFVGSLKIAKQP
jgi:hypothetical protein